MKIAYFPNQCAQNSAPVMSAVLSSLQKNGHECVENSMEADVAIIWSVLRAGRKSQNQTVWKHYRQQGRPVIVVDVGALYRGETWKIALNTITADGYYGHTQQLDWDRPRKLGISLAINVGRNPNIVIAAQHACSLQVANLTSIEDWIKTQVEFLKTHTDRPIVIRPHPRSPLNLTKLVDLPRNIVIEKPRRVINTYDSYNLTFDCHAMINYNSGPGIQAALAGTRVIVDSTSLAYPVSMSFDDIEKPYTIDRDQWLVEICHTEYTLSEIKNGMWLSRLDL